MASDGEWLGAVLVLLGPLSPRATGLLAHSPVHDEFLWVDEVPSGARLLAHAGAGEPERGWLLRLPSGAPRSLLFDGAAALDPAGAPLALARQLVRTAWRLREPVTGGAIRDAAGQAMHDLRNGLNSVSMTTAVVAGAALPAELRGFVDDLQAASRRSLRALAELAEWSMPR